MALNDEAKIGNLKRSIDLYCHTNLKTTEGLNVDFEGLPFNETEVNDWIQPRIFAETGMYYPGGTSTQYAEQVDVLLNVNIFTKKSGATTSERHYAIRDMVAGHFKIGQDITLYEESGTTSLNKLRVREIVNDQSLPETNELLQYIYAVRMDFTRLTDKP
jgi:hypothetical protein